MELAILSSGTRGDLYPMLGIARQAKARGHSVCILEYAEYSADVRDAGISFVSVAPGSQNASVFSGVPAGAATRFTEWMTERLSFEASLRSAPAFVSAARAMSPRPDAIVAPGFHLGAALAAEIMNIPVLSVYLGSSVLEPYDKTTISGFRSSSDARQASLIDRLATPHLLRLRREVGLSDSARGIARADIDGGIILAPSPLRHIPDIAPATFDTAGYPDYYGSDLGEDETLIRFLADRTLPLVVCTIGDGWAKVLPTPLLTLFDSADRGAFRLVFVGMRVHFIQPGRNTVVLKQANLPQLMLHADVSVNHGGMGTIVAALRAAVPSVTISQWPDGRRNARRLADNGLGVDLGTDPTSAALIESIDKVLSDRTLGNRLLSARAQMLTDPDPAETILKRLEIA